MTYEEKLHKIVSKLKSERELTRKGLKTKITLNDKSFTKPRIQDICKILFQLQDDEKAVVILGLYPPLDPFDPYEPSKVYTCDEAGSIELELDRAFDEWYPKYLLHQKSKPENLDWLNLLKIIDVCSDIDQKLQIGRNTTVTIQSFPYPYIGRFVDLLPVDNTATRKVYQQHRLEGAQYLLKEGIVLDVKYVNDDVLAYGDIVIKVDPVKFDEFYRMIRDVYRDRKQLQPKKTDEAIEKAPPSIEVVDEIVYEIIYTPQRQILMNSVQIAKPDFNSENDLVFTFLYAHPNERITIAKIEEVVGNKLTKSLHKIVENLGFEADLKEVFLSVSKTAIEFRNPITKKDLESMKRPTIKLIKGGGKLLLPH